jgi:hypothetical protein
MTRLKIAKLLFIVTQLVYLPLGWFVVFRFPAFTDGWTLFDIRVFGYSFDTGAQIIAALTPESVVLYTDRIRPLDTAIPVLLAASIIAFAWAWSERGGRRVLPVVVTGFAVITAALDFWENTQILALITGAKAPTQALIDAASSTTMLKFSSLACSLIVLSLIYSRRRKAG